MSPLWTEYAPHVLTKVPAEIRQFQSSADCQEKSFKSTYANKPVIFHDYFTFCCNTHTRSSFLHSSACYLRSHICRFLACTHAFISAHVSSAHTHTLVHTLELLRSNSWCQCAPWGLWALKSVRFNSPTGSSVWVKISSHSQRIFIQTQAHILGIWFHSYRSPTASLEFMQSVLWCSLRKRLCFFVSAQLKVAAYCSLITASFLLLICAHLITFMSPLEFCIIHLLLRCFLSVHFLSVFAFCYLCCNYSFFQSGFYSPLL